MDLWKRGNFTTSRASAFTSESELVRDVGFRRSQWPSVIAKELLDNGLDAAEDTRRDPVVTVDMEELVGGIVRVMVEDNGPGIPADVVTKFTDLSSRTSSRSLFATLSRGQQGNAMPLNIAMCSLHEDGPAGIEIRARGICHRLSIVTDAVTRIPSVKHARSADEEGVAGCRVTAWVHPGFNAIEPALAVTRLVRWARFCNPRAEINGDRIVMRDESGKWSAPKHPRFANKERPFAAWFTRDRFERLAAAVIGQGRAEERVPPVAEFIRNFRGMTAPASSKRVLDELGAQRMPLDRVLLEAGPDGAERFDETALEILHEAIGRHGARKAFKPERLGVLGPAAFVLPGKIGVDEEVAAYHGERVVSASAPAVVEAAVLRLNDAPADALSVVCINNSPPVVTSGWHLAGLEDEILPALELDERSGWCVLFHIASPAASFRDRAKRAIEAPDSVLEALERVVARIGKPVWKEADEERKHRDRIRKIEDKAEQDEAERQHRARREQRRQDRAEQEAARAGERERRKNEAEQEAARYFVPDSYDPIAKRMDEVLEEHGGPLSAWLAMSAKSDPYNKRALDALRWGHWFSEIMQEMPDHVRHLRGIFYVLVTRQTRKPDGTKFRNNLRDAGRLGEAAGHARWLGLVPWQRIEDHRNDTPWVPTTAPAKARRVTLWPPHAGLAPDILNGGADALAVEVRWRDDMKGHGAGREVTAETAALRAQPFTIILVMEKQSVLPVVRRFSREMGALLYQPTGEASNTMAEDIAAKINERGKPAYIGYLSDLDPQGARMPLNIARKLQALSDSGDLREQFALVPLALTVAQAHALRLPSTPLKDKNKAAPVWTEATGWAQTEIDALAALQPEVLAEIVEEALAPWFDGDLHERTLEAMKALRALPKRRCRITFPRRTGSRIVIGHGVPRAGSTSGLTCSMMR